MDGLIQIQVGCQWMSVRVVRDIKTHVSDGKAQPNVPCDVSEGNVVRLSS